MLNPSQYDYIFCGAGCASLSLLMRMLSSGKFSGKKILLIDRDAKNKNDRTWCFWEKENGFFDKIVYKKWGTISFLSDEFSSTTNISPYQYKMIRVIDFYNYCFEEIVRHSNIEIVYGNLDKSYAHKEGVTISLDDKTFLLGNAIVFNSIPRLRNIKPNSKKLLQHFTGWFIETKVPVFNSNQATMMDFRIPQDNGTTFAYVLPLNSKKALVEYTLFSRELLKPEVYEIGLKNYISNFLAIDKYIITESEFGVIPMTNDVFPFYNDGAFHIGTAGGQTKASSGYTFQFIQKQSQQIADCLITGDSLTTIMSPPKRFRFYDNTLLDILYNNTLSGKKIFTSLFKKNKPQQVLRFLNNESSLSDELKIISSLPTWPFLKAALKQL